MERGQILMYCCYSDELKHVLSVIQHCNNFMISTFYRGLLNVYHYMFHKKLPAVSSIMLLCNYHSCT